jgi:hypothetical protein
MNMRQSNHSYEKDFYKWSLIQADLLKRGEFSKADLKHIIEEIEDLGNEKRNALESQIIRLLMHLLKIKYQPEKHTYSWDKSIGNARIEIEKILKKNPSLKREVKNLMDDAYYYARKKAALETKLDIKIFEETCPWTFEEIMEE